MHPRAFCNAYTTDALNISGNNLNTLPQLCTLVDTIRYLHARNNKISTIIFGYFNDFINLHDLNLSENRLGNGFEPDFSPLSQTLRSIRLFGSPWGRVPASLYNATYSKLKAVYLDLSLISDISAEALRSWLYIILLSIRYNLIHCLNDIRNTTRRTKLRIRAINNPWHCGTCMVSVAYTHKCWNDTLDQGGTRKAGRWPGDAFANMS